MTTPIFPEIDATDGHFKGVATDTLYQRAATAVKTTGTQTVAGVKTFSSPPVVPTPVGSTDAANKAYVDGVPAAQGTVKRVHAESNGAGGWRWPLAGRPAGKAGDVDFHADGTGLARPNPDGSVTGGGGMVEGDGFYF